MAASHEGVVRAGCNACRKIDCNEQFIACPLSKTTVGVWWIPDLSKNPLQLSGHKKLVTCVCFGNKRRQLLLCTASEDFIYIWNITKGYANYSLGCHEDTFSPLCVGKALGSIQHIDFNSSDLLISACIGKEVWVLNIETCKLDSVLEGHTSPLTQAQFCPWNKFMIVSIAEDRTFKVWDIQKSCMLYQSPIVSGSPFISLAFDSTQRCMALGTTDGKVKIYDLDSGEGFRCMHDIDIGHQLQKTLDKQKIPEDAKTKGPAVISSNPSWQQEQHKLEKVTLDDTSLVDTEAGTSILGLQFMKIPGQKTQAAKSPLLPFLNAASQSQMNDIFHVSSILVVGMTAAIVLVNCSTWELLYVLDFKAPILSSNELDTVQYHLPTAGLYAFMEREQNRVQCLVSGLFNNDVHLVNIRIPTLKNNKSPIDVLASRLSQSTGLGTQGVCDTIDEKDLGRRVVAGTEPDQPVITVLSSAPLHTNSPLKAELVPKSSIPPSKKTPNKGPSSRGKSSSVQDQPLTFKPKVKSSGYTDAPRSKMFSPKTNAAKKTSVSLRKSSSGLSSGVIGKEYPMQANPPTQLKERLSLTSQPTGINCVTYSSNGRHLACALSNKSAHVLGVPLSNNKETVLTGHDGSLNQVQFSHDNKWLLTSSTDRTVRLWSPALSDPLLTFSTINHNFSVESDTKTKNKDNPPFPKEITQASFYYVDKFIMVSCGNGLYLYKYHIDPQKDDIKRYQSRSKYKLVKLFQQERAQNITCFSCVNGFHSYITLCCGSNKSIEVFDMNVGRSIRVVMDAHSRPVHAICQNQGSAYASHSPEAYDLFLTAAVTDGIKMWDLRTNRCVRRYEGHVNRSHPTGLAISPCSRFIATGSEDRSVYIFDVRGSSFCHRLTGHTEVVSDVAFHPAHCELVAASLDGKLKFYTEELR